MTTPTENPTTSIDTSGPLTVRHVHLMGCNGFDCEIPEHACAIDLTVLTLALIEVGGRLTEVAPRMYAEAVAAKYEEIAS